MARQPQICLQQRADLQHGKILKAPAGDLDRGRQAVAGEAGGHRKHRALGDVVEEAGHVEAMVPALRIHAVEMAVIQIGRLGGQGHGGADQRVVAVEDLTKRVPLPGPGMLELLVGDGAQVLG